MPGVLPSRALPTCLTRDLGLNLSVPHLDTGTKTLLASRGPRGWAGGGLAGISRTVSDAVSTLSLVRILRECLWGLLGFNKYTVWG